MQGQTSGLRSGHAAWLWQIPHFSVPAGLLFGFRNLLGQGNRFGEEKKARNGERGEEKENQRKAQDTKARGQSLQAGPGTAEWRVEPPVRNCLQVSHGPSLASEPVPASRGLCLVPNPCLCSRMLIFENVTPEGEGSGLGEPGPLGWVASFNVTGVLVREGDEDTDTQRTT